MKYDPPFESSPVLLPVDSSCLCELNLLSPVCIFVIECWAVPFVWSKDIWATGLTFMVMFSLVSNLSGVCWLEWWLLCYFWIVLTMFLSSKWPCGCLEMVESCLPLSPVLAAGSVSMHKWITLEAGWFLAFFYCYDILMWRCIYLLYYYWIFWLLYIIEGLTLLNDHNIQILYNQLNFLKN